jgi:glycosyltransferase involved in cell wall biosynthesis
VIEACHSEVRDISFIIAGRSPSKKLQALCKKHLNCCIVSNPSDDEMKDLIAKAQIHVLPSFNNTGVKLKLLNALFNGRHCVVNQAAVADSSLANYCHVANDADEFCKKVKELFSVDFTDADIQKRQGLLQHEFNNEANAKKIIEILGY